MPRYAKHVFLLAFLSISDITFRSRCSLASALSAIRSSTSSLGMTGADYLSLGRKINIRVSSWNLSFLYAHSKFQNSNRSFAPRNSISKSTSAVTKAPRFSRSGAHLDFVRSWRKRPNTSSRSKRAQWRSTVRDQHAENLLPSKSVQCLSSLVSCNRLLLFLHVQIKDYAVKKKKKHIFSFPARSIHARKHQVLWYLNRMPLKAARWQHRKLHLALQQSLQLGICLTRTEAAGELRLRNRCG